MQHSNKQRLFLCIRINSSLSYHTQKSNTIKSGRFFIYLFIIYSPPRTITRMLLFLFQRKNFFSLRSYSFKKIIYHFKLQFKLLSTIVFYDSYTTYIVWVTPKNIKLVSNQVSKRDTTYGWCPLQLDGTNFSFCA